DYAGSGGAETVRVLAPELAEGMPPQTSVQATFVNLDTADPDEIQREKARDASQLLQWTNRLLRRYRAVTRRADLIELHRAHAASVRHSPTDSNACPRAHWPANTCPNTRPDMSATPCRRPTYRCRLRGQCFVAAPTSARYVRIP